MKIYFAASIRGGRENVETYKKIIERLNSHGKVLTEHIGDSSLTDSGEKGLTDIEIFQRDTKWIREADVLVADVTTPSVGVGYEIGFAESIGKPILCLYNLETATKKISGMISGNENLQAKSYPNLDAAFKHIDEFLTKKSNNK